MALVRSVCCGLKSQSPDVQKGDLGLSSLVQNIRLPDLSPNGTETGAAGTKIVLQPRLCTLRTYGPGDRVGFVKSRLASSEDDKVSRFFATLSDYIDSSKKSQDFEIISGRLAMVVFAVTISTEVVTGNSVFRKTDWQGFAEAAMVCLGAIASAAVFAWFSSNRKRVGQIFTVRCSAFIDSLVDQIIDSLFYEDDDDQFSDWSDDV